nr:hypothetical protein [Tanacetum cinerariifolium]
WVHGFRTILRGFLKQVGCLIKIINNLVPETPIRTTIVRSVQSSTRQTFFNQEDLFTYCIENGILQDASKPSIDNANVVNALQEPFVVKQDPGKGAHYGYNCPPNVLIILDPKPFNNQTIDKIPQTLLSFDPTCYSEDGYSFTYDSRSNLVDDFPN